MEKVKGITKQLKNDENAVGQALEEYLVSKSGPFQEAQPGEDDWAESGKARRAKKASCVLLSYVTTSKFTLLFSLPRTCLPDSFCLYLHHPRILIRRTMNPEARK